MNRQTGSGHARLSVPRQNRRALEVNLRLALALQVIHLRTTCLHFTPILLRYFMHCIRVPAHKYAAVSLLPPPHTGLQAAFSWTMWPPYKTIYGSLVHDV